MKGKTFSPMPCNNTLTAKQLSQLINISTRVQSKIGWQSREAWEEPAFIVLVRICRDYVDNCSDLDEYREKQLIERLNRFKMKFFERI